MKQKNVYFLYYHYFGLINLDGFSRVHQTCFIINIMTINYQYNQNEERSPHLPKP